MCSRIRGNVDLIKDGKGGILVSPGNKEDYEAAFRKLYEMKHKELTDFRGWDTSMQKRCRVWKKGCGVCDGKCIFTKMENKW